MIAVPSPDRESALIRTFRAAFAALDDLRQKLPEAASRIADIVASHMRSAHPMAMLSMPAPDPVSSVSRDLGDGARYDISIVGGCIVLHIVDVMEGDVVPAFTVQQMRQLIADAQSVMAGMR